MKTSQSKHYNDLKVFFGDIHNHCGMSYGKGSIANAFSNAQLQLDFVSITIHAVWPDLPQDDPRLSYLVDYHEKGFAKASENWPAYLQAVEENNVEGKFVTFPSFEWHSNEFGDHCVYFKHCDRARILTADNLPSLREEASQIPTSTMIIPHHIGYKKGSRGINWQAYDRTLSPVIEIFSFHGLSESSEGPYPYLHSMGPCHELSTAQHGWSLGNVFGVIGSTDHHNAFPGSYGFGRVAVWASQLTRDAIWEAFFKRRTYALTGDRIQLGFSLNGHLMGDIVPSASQRNIEISVRGSNAIDTIEILHNNQIIHRDCVLPQRPNSQVYKVYFEVGWGEGFSTTAWDVDMKINQGTLIAVEPCFRGYSPTENPGESELAYTKWSQTDTNTVRFQTLTRPNISLRSSSTEGLILEFIGDETTILQATVNGTEYSLSLSDLMTGSRTFYMGGFVSPAICFHRAIPESEYAIQIQFQHDCDSTQRDWYYVRVRQKNDQWAWSSPIWVEKPDSHIR